MVVEPHAVVERVSKIAPVRFALLGLGKLFHHGRELTV